MFSRIYILLIIPFLPSCAVFRLLNSGTTHVKYTVAKAKFDNITYENKQRLGDVSFSIRNVQHPKKYGKWAMNLRLSPSIHLDKTTYSTLEKYTNENGNYVTRPDIEVRRLMTLANIKATTHTPIGAFALSAGFGGGVIKKDDERGLDTITTREVRRIDFVYYGFFAKRFYFLMGPRYYKEENESYQFAFRLGYFWGKI